MSYSRESLPQTSRILDKFATRLGLAFCLTVLVVTCLGAGFYAERSVRQLEEDHSIFKDQQLRNGFQSMSDMKRLLLVTKKATAQGSFDDELRAEYVRAVDILFVRKENFRRVLDTGIRLQAADETVALLGEMIRVADAASAADFEELQQLETDLLHASEAVRQSLVKFLDDMDRLQRSVLDEQSRAVSEQRLVIQASLGALTVIGMAALLLLRREVVSRRARERAERDVHFLAYFDSLSGLPNRAQFQSRLGNLLERSGPVALIFVDLDDFKGINDTYGHATGDAVLKRVADILSVAAESDDGFAARLGGDEFAMVLPNKNLKRLEKTCESILAQAEKGVSHEGEQVQFGLSIGLATNTLVNQGLQCDLDTLCRVTDFALYASKESGKGTVTVYDIELERRYLERKSMIDELPHAIAHGDLVIYLQPKVRLPERATYGFEGLVRWHRNGRLVPPDEFITVAEESGLIIELDRYMLTKCTDLIASHNRICGTEYSISVNLSAVHFSSRRIVSWVLEALDASGLKPHLLTLEITETVEMRDWRRAQNIISKLRDVGVRIAIDDFGTGYSSLRYLRSTAADELKIDKSLVDHIETTEKARFLLDGVLDMARNLNLDVVVEGVETEGQGQTISDMGATLAQGYLYGRARPASEALQLFVPSSSKSA